MPASSRYHITNEDLRQAALALQVGEGMADRIKTNESTDFIARAEDWAESQVEEFIGTPLKPTRAPGQSRTEFTVQMNQNSLTKRNFPHDFIQATIYRATGLFLQSEFFENNPNASEAGKWALELAQMHISDFKERRTSRVGSGRLRHRNPFMPPTIAPHLDSPPQNPGLGGK